MKIIKKGIVYRVTQGPFQYQAWPSVCVDENGTLYAVCSGHRIAHVCPFGKDLMFVSHDGGESWSLPTIVNDTWLDDRDAGITYLGDGKMILSYFTHPTEAYMKTWRGWLLRDAANYAPMVEGMLKCYDEYTPEQNRAGSFVKLSSDYGKSWGDAIQVPVSAPHGPVFTASGRLLYLGRETQGTFNRYDANADDSADPTPKEERGLIFLYESFDDGKTWERLSQVKYPDDVTPDKFCEPHIVELQNGELIAAIRVHDHPTVYDNYTIYFASSTDGGKSWSDMWKLGHYGSPPHLCLLKDGSVVITYGRRTEPHGVRAVVSKDGCRTFSDEFILWDSHCGDLGYPATVQLEDGTLLTVHYQRYGDDKRTSIVYTKWEI